MSKEFHHIDLIDLFEELANTVQEKLTKALDAGITDGRIPVGTLVAVNPDDPTQVVVSFDSAKGQVPLGIVAEAARIDGVVNVVTMPGPMRLPALPSIPSLPRFDFDLSDGHD